MARTKKYEPLPGQQTFDLFLEEEQEVEKETEAEKEEKTSTSEVAGTLADLSMHWWTGKNLMDRFKEYVRWYKNRRTIENCLVDRKIIPGDLSKIFEKRFHNDLNEVINYVSDLEQDYLSALRLYNASCQKLQIPLTSDDWMRSALWENAGRRQSIADKCARRFEHPENKLYRLVPLEEL